MKRSVGMIAVLPLGRWIFYQALERIGALLWSYIIVTLIATSILLPNKAAQGSTIVEQAFLGSQRLPVYNVRPSVRARWLQRNAVHLMRDVVNYDALTQRVNPILSTACAQGRFSQRVLEKYFILAKRHTRGREIVVLGFAKSGGGKAGAINLYDPDQLAEQDTHYLFQYDRSGRCKVFRMGDR